MLMSSDCDSMVFASKLGAGKCIKIWSSIPSAKQVSWLAKHTTACPSLQ